MGSFTTGALFGGIAPSSFKSEEAKIFVQKSGSSISTLHSFEPSNKSSLLALKLALLKVKSLIEFVACTRVLVLLIRIVSISSSMKLLLSTSFPSSARTS